MSADFRSKPVHRADPLWGLAPCDPLGAAAALCASGPRFIRPNSQRVSISLRLWTLDNFVESGERPPSPATS